jgi:RNA polymerase sigma factor (sigma-70 family)
VVLRHKTAMENVIKGVQSAGEFALTTTNQGRAGARFDTLFREHYPRVVSLLTRLTGDRGQAEEIGSDVFCKLARRPGLQEEAKDLLPWVYRVATNAGLDALRANSRRKRREEAAGVETLRTAGADSALEGILREERCARVREVLAGLKARDAQLLLLRSNGLPYRELAKILGIQASSVGTLLARAEAEFERRYRARYGDNV